MLGKEILTIGIVSTLLSNTLLFAEGNACQGNCFAILDQPRDQVSDVKKIDEHDRSFIHLLDADPFTDFPPHKIMEPERCIVDEEVIDETVDEELVVTELIVSTFEKIEDVILDKPILKDSLYYCENEKKAQFNEFTDLYQCV